MIRIPPGIHVIVHSDEAAITENSARARSGGTRFIPPWLVWAYGVAENLPDGFEKLWHTGDGYAVARYRAVSFSVKGMQPAVVTDKFPYAWAPRDLQAVSAWLETRAGCALTETFNEEIK